MERVGAIIPVYNEASSFYGNLPYISRMFTPLNDVVDNGILQTIVWVDDGSTDGTANLIKKAIKGNQELLSHQENRGKAAAFLTGFKAVQDLDLILTLDADFIDLTAEKISDFLSYMNPYLDMIVLEYKQLEGECTALWSGVRAIHSSCLQELLNPENLYFENWMKFFYPDSTRHHGYGLEVALNRLVDEEKTLIVREIPLTSRRPGGGQFDVTKIVGDFKYASDILS